MPTNPPEEQIVLVRGSAEYKDYMRHQAGWLRALVNGLEDYLSIAGRALLLLFLIYTTVKAGMTMMGVAAPIWLEVLMLSLQVAGVEGAVPGLARYKEVLQHQPGKEKDIKTIRNAIMSTRTLAVLTGIEIILFLTPHIAFMGQVYELGWLDDLYSKSLLIARLVVISNFLIAMASMEQKAPKVISQAEYDKKQREREQDQIRMDNVSIQAAVQQELAGWKKAQERVFSEWSIALASRLQSDQARLFDELLGKAISDMQTRLERNLAVISAEQDKMEVAIQQVQNIPLRTSTIDTQALIQSVTDYLIPQFQAKFQELDQAILRQNVAISEVANQAKRLPETAVSVRQNQAKPVFSNQSHQPEQHVLRLVPANASREEIIAEVIRLHEVEGLSSYKIAEKLGKPAKTVQSWLSKGKVQAASEAIEFTH